ncbi:MAG TPA: glutathione S-transferase family protein [Polyangiales bacterium]
MTEPVVLYYNPNSRARVVHWLLEEIGVPYRIELLRFDQQQHKRPEYLRLNPMGKVPCIVDHHTVVTECGAICVYLADNYPRAQLAPALHDPARASYLRWLFFAAGCLEPALVDRMFQRSAVPPSSIGYGSYEDVLNAIELALTPGPYILGDRFSAADVYLGSELVWGSMTKALEPRARFTEYAERLAERPAFKRFSAQNRTLSAQLSRESAA